MKVASCLLENSVDIVTNKKTYAVVGIVLLIIGTLSCFFPLVFPGLNSVGNSCLIGTGIILGMIYLYLNHNEKLQKSLCKWSPFTALEGEVGTLLKSSKKQVTKYIQGEEPIPQHVDRIMGAMMGGAVGDALGAGLEFVPQRKSGREIPGKQLHMTTEGVTGTWVDVKQNMETFALWPGQWTDDTAMMLCLADSFLEKRGKLVGTHAMDNFVKWKDRGLNNGFNRHPHKTMDVGTQIRKSLTVYKLQKRTQGVKTGSYKASGSEHASGNGSLMRLAPTAFGKSLKESMKLSKNQSRLTHSGTEATDCAQLMTCILFSFINCSEKDPQVVKEFVLGKDPYIAQHILHLCPSVKALARSSNAYPSSSRPDQIENWNWKGEDFDYHPSRSCTGLSGGYAMDALSMSLHCIWTTTKADDAIRKAARMCGDADTVACITGQLAGALYGYSCLNKDWRDAVHQHDNQGEIPARAYALASLMRTAE